jgi:hypothetical protein
MLVIVGLTVFLVSGLVAIVAVPGNAWAGHPPTENFAVTGYHPAGSTGTLFLLRIVVGVVAPLGLSGLTVGARRSASRAADARRAAARFRRETAFLNRDRDTRLQHQQRADTARTAASGESAPTRPERPPPVRARQTGTEIRGWPAGHAIDNL